MYAGGGACMPGGDITRGDIDLYMFTCVWIALELFSQHTVSCTSWQSKFWLFSFFGPKNFFPPSLKSRYPPLNLGGGGGRKYDHNFKAINLYNWMCFNETEHCICYCCKSKLFFCTTHFFCWQFHFWLEAGVATKFRKNEAESCYRIACVLTDFCINLKG